MGKTLNKTILAATVALISFGALSAAEAGGRHRFGGGFGHGFHGHHHFGGGFNTGGFGFKKKCGFYRFGRFIPCSR